MTRQSGEWGDGREVCAWGGLAIRTGRVVCRWDRSKKIRDRAECVKKKTSEGQEYTSGGEDKTIGIKTLLLGTIMEGGVVVVVQDVGVTDINGGGSAGDDRRCWRRCW